MSYELVRGTRDILPGEIERWHRIEDTFRSVAARYNFHEARFPILEHTELFARGIGEATEVVGKQMFTFLDQGDRSLTLRPEGTASAVRAYLNAGLHINDPFQKWSYLGPMFRYEKPQKGRYRQFYQYGVEVFGSLEPTVDAEVIACAWTLMGELGLGGLKLKLNSIGCPEDRARFNEVLRAHFAPSIGSMCNDCKRRLDENPLRILDCKEPACQPFIEGAPGSADHLCENCAEHFASVQKLLDRLGLAYEIDARLVRGLDYYTRTVFELISEDLGSQDALLGGGRYDGLVETLGGPSTPGIGFAGGIDRLAIVLEEREEESALAAGLDLYLIALGAEGHAFALKLADGLRKLGLCVDLDHRNRKFNKQMSEANRLDARHLLVIGEDEVTSASGKLKTMATGEEADVELTPEAIAAIVQGG